MLNRFNGGSGLAPPAILLTLTILVSHTGPVHADEPRPGHPLSAASGTSRKLPPASAEESEVLIWTDESESASAVRQPASSPIHPDRVAEPTPAPVRRGFVRLQDTLAQDWRDHAAGEPARFGKWMALPPAPDLTCRLGRKPPSTGASPSVETTVERCDTPLSSPFTDPDSRLPAYEVSYIHLRNRRLNAVQFFRKIDEAFNGEPFTSIETRYATETGNREFHTRPDCSMQTVVNGAGVPIKIRYCVSGLMKHAPLVDALVKIVTVDDTEESLMLFLRLGGFAPANLRSLVMEAIEGMRLGSEEGPP